MRKSFKGWRGPQNTTKYFRVNEKIFSREVIVIDEEGKNLGSLSKEQALEEARNRNLDLVEVSPKVTPPICKIMDYGSFRYQQKKLERKQRARTKTVEVKIIKLSLRISQHDLEIRARQALKFLTDNNKVRIELQLRGRENQHLDIAQENIKQMLEQIGSKLDNKSLKLEQEIKKQGNTLSAIISL